ncbi:SLAP domain-containing protein [Ornithinibacillus salinisoli]|uniref:SLAP domain-containing protein n=1 Tax=Ornithinibacillus salinisoli TaxID=1848459 RepID=A0ABW4W526_9BACI
MQKLLFEDAWDRTISDGDRKWIQHVFENTKLPLDQVLFTSLRQAINHRGDLLVSVIVHNTKNTEIAPVQQHFSYVVDHKLIAEHTFSIPTIKSKTSMPWTFIFPKGSYKENEELLGGEIERK